MYHFDNLKNVPIELQQEKAWVCWRAVWDEKKQKNDKIPIDPKTGRNAKSNDPNTWADYKTAVIVGKKNNFAGIGFMFSNNNYFGVDIDNCIDSDGKCSEMAKDILSTIKSYTEKSPSGKGLHIIAKGKLPKGGRRNKNGLEMYDQGRFFTVTGEVFENYTSIAERNEQIKAIHEKYIAVKKESEKTKTTNITNIVLSENDILIKAANAKHGQRFTELLNGDWQGAYPSQSEADQAFCNMLAFWTAKDAALMDNIFKKSGLFRDKWDKVHNGSETYGEMTISSAIRDCKNIYEPKPRNAEVAETVTKQEKKKRFTFDDTGNAQRLFHAHGNDLRYSFVNNCWYIWSGQYWQEDKTGEIKRRADQTIRDLYIEARDEENEEVAKALTKWITQCRNSARKKSMITETQHIKGIPITPDDIDIDPWLLNCNNGTINLKTGELMKHNRKDMITKNAPVEYNPKAKAEKWIKFLYKVMDGNKELVDFLQRAIGYSLTGNMSEQCIFMTYGSGANGKSTFLETIQAMLGDYSKSTSMQTFLVKQGDSASNDIARLFGARFVATVEADEGKKLSEALVKQITGGDKMTARFLHKEFFEFIPQFKIWMGTNHKPVIKGTDNGIWRRIRLIPFMVTIPKEEQDGNLKDKLANEWPGILAWAVKGCLEWQKQGLNPPQEIIAANESYRAEMDIIKGFLNDCCVKKPGSFLQSSTLYDMYKKWCYINGEHEFSQTKFSLKLKEKGLKNKKSVGLIYWEDITLSPYSNMVKMGDTGKNRNIEEERTS